MLELKIPVSQIEVRTLLKTLVMLCRKLRRGFDWGSRVNCPYMTGRLKARLDWFSLKSCICRGVRTSHTTRDARLQGAMHGRRCARERPQAHETTANPPSTFLLWCAGVLIV